MRNSINDPRIHRIRRAYDDGASIQDLSDTFGMVRSDITAILDARVVYPDTRLMPGGALRSDFPEWCSCEGNLRAIFARNMALARRGSAFAEPDAA